MPIGPLEIHVFMCIFPSWSGVIYELIPYHMPYSQLPMQDRHLFHLRPSFLPQYLESRTAAVFPMSDIDSDQEETTSGAGNLQRIVPPEILSELAHLDLSGRLTSKKPRVVGNGAFGDVYMGRCELPSRGRIKVAIKLLRFCVSEDVKMVS